MLTTLFSLLLFCVAPESVNAPPTPVVSWLTEQDHDFGEVPSGKTVHFLFKYKNISTEPLLLQTVRTTCGCTAADWTEEPVMPGGTGQISIEFESSQRGAFHKKIRVFFDKQRKAEILWIGGEVQ
ncbi:MAG TPA: DUF1573 domain-containing protein [Saprospiraceae bacterium]|nr:DUF1573 domain-containing protein [Saprospiraceae bacterium]HNM26342.1 DUF1573 domain-containing protein [Saprospiraceae bacterium]